MFDTVDEAINVGILHESDPEQVGDNVVVDASRQLLDEVLKSGP